MDEVVSPELTIKAVGHQWYWSYEFGDNRAEWGESLVFDAYAKPTDTLEP